MHFFDIRIAVSVLKCNPICKVKCFPNLSEKVLLRDQVLSETSILHRFVIREPTHVKSISVGGKANQKINSM